MDYQHTIENCRAMMAAFIEDNILSKIAKDAINTIETLAVQNTAMLADLKESAEKDCVCTYCAHYAAVNGNQDGGCECECDVCMKQCPCKNCTNGSGWEWRGVQRHE